MCFVVCLLLLFSFVVVCCCFCFCFGGQRRGIVVVVVVVCFAVFRQMRGETGFEPMSTAFASLKSCRWAKPVWVKLV